ncbi:hypothetical protein RE6C_04335 [Rhodopirellula europaea 6C]|uniref:Uncharacterized protein n=1 Tax=Rhodopirellula europaea 6C TaxID=1263867 RepID=M2AZP3_9BACT|nr:hypothetical protein RE6C_04335 [Rhodopirellula europaea 6C]
MSQPAPIDLANGHIQPKTKRIEFGRWPKESMFSPVPGTSSQATLKKAFGHR